MATKHSEAEHHGVYECGITEDVTYSPAMLIPTQRFDRAVIVGGAIGLVLYVGALAIGRTMDDVLDLPDAILGGVWVFGVVVLSLSCAATVWLTVTRRWLTHWVRNALAVIAAIMTAAVVFYGAIRWPLFVLLESVGRR